jgi:hypothetical protein
MMKVSSTTFPLGWSLAFYPTETSQDLHYTIFFVLVHEEVHTTVVTFLVLSLSSDIGS